MEPERLTMVCGACGRETPRALRRCEHCGSDAHASSPICGACPACGVAVRETQVVCWNCGRVLDPAALRQVPPPQPLGRFEPQTLWKRVRAALSAAVWSVRLLGLAVAALGASRVYLNLDYFRLSDLYEQEIAVLGHAAMWFAVLALGVGIFALSFSLKPEE